MDDHNGSLDFPTRTSRLAPTLAPSPAAHVVALVCIVAMRVTSSSLVCTSSSFCLPPNCSSSSVTLLQGTLPLLASKVGLTVH